MQVLLSCELQLVYVPSEHALLVFCADQLWTVSNRLLHAEGIANVLHLGTQISVSFSSRVRYHRPHTRAFEKSSYPDVFHARLLTRRLVFVYGIVLCVCFPLYLARKLVFLSRKDVLYCTRSFACVLIALDWALGAAICELTHHGLTSRNVNASEHIDHDFADIARGGL